MKVIISNEITITEATQEILDAGVSLYFLTRNMLKKNVWDCG